MKLFEFIVKKRVFFGFLFALFFLYFAKPSVEAVMLGFPIGAVGLFVRAWSSGLIRKNKELAQQGPYAMTRNPLYVGSFIAGCGVAIMGGSWILAGIFVVAYLTVYHQIILNEERHLVKLFPDAWEGYTQRVPRFFPNPMKFEGFGDYDPVHMLTKHKEWQAWLGYLAITCVMLAKGLGYWPELP